MSHVWQKTSEGYQAIETAIPVRSLGRFIVKVDRKGQWPVEYGFLLNGEPILWTRVETDAERAEREAANARIHARNIAAFEEYVAEWNKWRLHGRGREPELADPIDIDRRGRVERALDQVLACHGMIMTESERLQVRVLDIPRPWFIRKAEPLQKGQQP